MTQYKNLIHHLNSEQRKREELETRKKLKYEYDSRRLDTTTNFNRIPDMKSAYKKVLEKGNVTFNDDYLRVTGNLKYKL